MGDTGWLRPNVVRVGVPTGDPGSDWIFRERFGIERNNATSSWMALNQFDPSLPDETAHFGWKWVYPSDLVPQGSVVTGIEFRLWGYFYEHSGNPEGIYCNPTHLRVGGATLIDEAPGNVATRFRSIPYGAPPAFPDDADPPDAESLIDIGGPTELFDLGSGYDANQLLSEFASNTSGGQFNSIVKCGVARVSPDPVQPYEAGMYLSHAQIKVHWEVPSEIIDLPDTEPEVSVSAIGDGQVIKRLAALVAVDVIVEQAQLGNIDTIRSDPEVNVGMDADLTNGLGFIDSTSLPTVVFTIPDVDLALLRFSDMISSPDVAVSMVAVPPGSRVNLSSNPIVNASLGHSLESVIINDVEPTIVISVQADLSADTDMTATPKIYTTVTANLQGDINIASECGEAELTTVVSLIGNLGYTRGLYAHPNVYVTLDGDGLVVGAALEFTPLVSVTMAAALRHKYAEPAPDHRTVFKCPVDRTIHITRKDKTIL